ncbi:MAG TPA: hypothetical protein VLA61_16150 [Ideonella sp.]|uniref:hypothetical protein n=1 Tax=Ideonella sp. TaxID=1929293 RepID=UPI002C4F5433|nr:hypothetical protein [Ideonella sp.]HSI49804.1 hypothetical protein [Ideonella sp.]
MKMIKKWVACAAVLAFTAVSSTAVAQVTNTYTYAGLAWGFSSGHPGFSTCSTLFLDATGDVYNSDNYSIYGQLYCPSLNGSYASVGNAYFDSFNGFHMTIRLSVTHNLVCDNLSGNTLSGSCPIYDNLGVQTGTAFINLL